MIRRFLTREGRILLDELNAPDARILLLRVAFGVFSITFVGGALLGVLWVNNIFGPEAMWAVVLLITLLAIWTVPRRPLYTRSGGLAELFGERGPSLPPPRTQALPPPAAPQIGPAQRQALPGPRSR